MRGSSGSLRMLHGAQRVCGDQSSQKVGGRRLTQPPLVLILLLVGSLRAAGATLWSSGYFLLPSTRYPQRDGQLSILQNTSKETGENRLKNLNFLSFLYVFSKQHMLRQNVFI